MTHTRPEDRVFLLPVTELRRGYLALAKVGNDPRPVSLDSGACRYCHWTFPIPQDQPLAQVAAEVWSEAAHPEWCPWRIGREAGRVLADH